MYRIDFLKRVFTLPQPENSQEGQMEDNAIAVHISSAELNVIVDFFWDTCVILSIPSLT